jgi:hypothetical protein
VQYTSKPTLNQYAGYDTNDDTIQHLNYWASGTTQDRAASTSRPRS